MIAEGKKTEGKSKGGRPKKAIRRNYVIKVKCTILERKVIERRANEVGMKLSEYLREKGLSGNIVSKQKALPKGVFRVQSNPSSHRSEPQSNRQEMQ